jgi:FtsP/CotA-like multicopper oxidase with cupredoxin domain
MIGSIKRDGVSGRALIFFLAAQIFPFEMAAGKVTRRGVLAGLVPVLGAGAAAKLGALPPTGAVAAAPGATNPDHSGHIHDLTAGTTHAGFRPGATVDHKANGFNPTELLRDFDLGRTRRLPSGRVLREWELVAADKELEVAPGVRFQAWTYNGRVPGPTLRCREGELLRVRFVNGSAHPHTIHFHGVHRAGMDGMPGIGEMTGGGVIESGGSFTYEFEAAPFGFHHYHCHTSPLAAHIHKGLYGAFIVDPEHGRSEADELVMVMNGFDTNSDQSNEIYAVNTIGFHYLNEPVKVKRDRLVRIYLLNILEFDQINSFHVHANFFHYHPTGTSLEPAEFTDTVALAQGQRGILELRFPYPGKYMFHAHKTEFAELGWMGFFEVED